MAKLTDDASNIGHDIPDDGSNFGEDFQPEVFAASRRWQVIWPRVIARAWADPTFKESLLKNPREVLKGPDFNYELSEGVDLTIVEAPDTPGFQAGQPDP